MESLITFEDVLIKPKFSTIKSRKNVDVSSNFLDISLSLPVISSNMDSITDGRMCVAMNQYGAIGALNRFCTIDENVKQFDIANKRAIVSVGLGEQELLRAEALVKAGAKHILIDVANGASLDCVMQYNKLRTLYGLDVKIVVGNFATAESIREFNKYIPVELALPDAYKVGVGGGSVCTTRIKTGCGMPTLSSVIDCATLHYPIIADGGLRTPGDIAKALAAGASAVMLGYMFAGCEETAGELVESYADKELNFISNIRQNEFQYEVKFKKYIGSASKESYLIQGKNDSWRTPEGESTLVPFKGSVKEVLQDIEGGLRSALSYTNSYNLSEFVTNSEFVRITQSSIKESRAHAKE